MNDLQLRVAVARDKCFLDDNDQPLDSIDVYLSIDGHSLIDEESDLIVNARQLALSTMADGEYEIFACSCGSAGCANIQDLVHVTHGDAIVSWKLGDADGLADARFEEGATFVRGQYLAVIKSAMSEGRRIYAAREQLGLRLDSDDEDYWGPDAPTL